MLWTSAIRSKLHTTSLPRERKRCSSNSGSKGRQSIPQDPYLFRFDAWLRLRFAEIVSQIIASDNAIGGLNPSRPILFSVCCLIEAAICRDRQPDYRKR